MHGAGADEAIRQAGRPNDGVADSTYRGCCQAQRGRDKTYCHRQHTCIPPDERGRILIASVHQRGIGGELDRCSLTNSQYLVDAGAV